MSIQQIISHYESMVYNNTSIASRDYTEPNKNIKDMKTLLGVPKTSKHICAQQRRQVCAALQRGHLKDMHKITDWDRRNISFELMVQPKEIIRTHPDDVQKLYMEKPRDLKRQEVQKTRPRVQFNTASLDDMPEPDRQIAIDDVYLTTKEKANREATSKWVREEKAPLCPKMTPATPISIEPVQLSYVSPEWRMESVRWDSERMRGSFDSTRGFWISRPPPKCLVCTSTAKRDAAHKRALLAKARRPLTH